MSSFAIVSSVLVVRAVVEFFGPGTWDEPAVEADAVGFIQDWNRDSGNPLRLVAGDIILKTDPNAEVTGFRGRFAGIGYAWDPEHQVFIEAQP